MDGWIDRWGTEPSVAGSPAQRQYASQKVAAQPPHFDVGGSVDDASVDGAAAAGAAAANGGGGGDDDDAAPRGWKPDAADAVTAASRRIGRRRPDSVLIWAT